MKRFSMAVTSLLILVLSGSASPRTPPILRSGTHPMWADFTMGGAINAKDSLSQLKLGQSFGYHFNGDSSGPAIAFDLQESFGDNWVVFQTGPKFVWDIPVKEGLGLYLSPSFMLGFAVASPSGYDSGKGITIQLGFRGKLLLGDRGFVFFQPMGFDISWLSYNGYSNTGVRYELLFGGGVTF
jgi:hypothetical protein